MPSLNPAAIVFAAASGDHIRLILIVVIVLAAIVARWAYKQQRRRGAGDGR